MTPLLDLNRLRQLASHSSLGALVAVGALAVIVRLWLGPFVVDDAYISFRYSRNLASGLGFTYNPPHAVMGSTSPLYVLLMVAPIWLGWDPGWASLVIAACADVVTIGAGAAVLFRIGQPLAAWLFAVFIALWPAFLTYSVAGLETSLYVALVSVTLLRPWRRYPGLRGGILSLLLLCRPDGVIALMVDAPRLIRQGRRRVAAIVALCLGSWALFCIWYFGSVVPSSVRAKAALRLTSGESFVIFASYFSAGIYLPLSIAAIVGVVLTARRRSELRAVCVWWVLYTAAFIASGGFSHFPWYFVPLLPLYFMGVAIAIEQGLRLLPYRPVRWIYAPLVIVTAVLLISRLPAHRANLTEMRRGREDLYKMVAKSLDPSDGCIVAVTEVGAIGYFYPGPVLDLLGLVSPSSIGRSMDSTIAAERPCWVVSYDDHLPMTAGPETALGQHYTLRQSYPVGPARTLLVFARR